MAIRYNLEVVIPEQTFINPYTFVPLPDTSPHRGQPHGHAGHDSSLLTGRLRVTFTARTPVLVRGFGSDQHPQVPTRPTASGEREKIIPGSAIHGAVRAVHEAATGSCLRVLDTDFVPSYRQPAERGTQNLRLAVVVTPPQDPTVGPVVQLCEPGDPVAQRLDQDILSVLHEKAQPVGLCSGDRLRIGLDESGKVTTAELDAQGEWVVFISDSGARLPEDPYRAAIRKLGTQMTTVPAPVWADFLRAVAGADDLRPARLAQEPESQRFTDVQHWYQLKGTAGSSIAVGRRSLARTTVHSGQPLWARLDSAGVVDQVRLAMVWRVPGAISAGARAGAHTPCWDPAALCPSCRLFGSADTRGEPSEKGRAFQRSYRGHVRFTDAIAAPETRTIEVTLPPTGAPKPGAGQFYLANAADTRGNMGNPALREWGSAADRPGTPRPLRGRKFYWHTDVPSGVLPRRGRATARHDGKTMVSSAVAYRIGTVFTTTVTFTDIDRGQLASLIVALCPRLGFGPNAVAHLGGGRPLGYGSCTATIDTTASWWTTARDRYHGRTPTMISPTDLAGLAAEFTDTVADGLRSALTTVLTMGAVPEKQVAYPPGDIVQPDDESDVTFAFWKQSSGLELAPDKETAVRQGYPLIPLPELDDDPGLPVVRKATATPAGRQHPLDNGVRGGRRR